MPTTPTNATLPDAYFADVDPKYKIWITSIPTYYCKNPGAQDDFSGDNVWLGVSATLTGQVGTPVQYTTGVKFAITYPDEFGAQSPSYYNNGGAKTGWVSLSDPASPYYVAGSAEGNWGLQTTYRIGQSQINMPFGPYDLSKTTDGTPYPATDGDIIIITTGSTVIAGALGDGASPNGIGDDRIYNLIFYSTGSADISSLIAKIPQNQSPGANTDITTYHRSERANFVRFSGGLYAFAAIPNAGLSTLGWWPITWEATSVIDVVSRNDS